MALKPYFTYALQVLGHVQALILKAKQKYMPFYKLLVRIPSLQRTKLMAQRVFCNEPAVRGWFLLDIRQKAWSNC